MILSCNCKQKVCMVEDIYYLVMFLGGQILYNIETNCNFNQIAKITHFPKGYLLEHNSWYKHLLDLYVKNKQFDRNFTV